MPSPLPADTAQANWSVDPAHSKIGFSVRHFLTPLEGRFREFEASLDWNQLDATKSHVRATIAASSIDTGLEKRDKHLHSADFFDTAEHPDITFASTDVRAEGRDRLHVTGDLTIKDVTRQVEFPVRILGVREVPEAVRDMVGGAVRVAAFEAELVIDRVDYGIGVGDWADTPVLGRDVTLRLLIEASHE